METVVLVDHLAHIFFDLVVPLAVVWFGYSLRHWLPEDVDMQRLVALLLAALAR